MLKRGLAVSGGLVADAGLVPGSERMADFTARLAERIEDFSAEARRPPSDADMLSMARDLTLPGRLRGSDGGKGEEASSLDLGKISTALNAPGAGLTRGFTKAILSAGDLLGVIPSETATKLSALLDEEAAAATKGNPVAGVLDEGGAISGQYLLPFLRVTRVLELLGAGKIVAGMMGGLATDFVFTGQNDASIGEVARDIGPLDQPVLEMVRSAVAEGLAKNESDGAFEKRLKNVGAGLLAPAAITAIGGLYRAARAGTPLARQSFQSFARAVDEAHARVTKNAANGVRSGRRDTDKILAGLKPMIDEIRATTAVGDVAPSLNAGYNPPPREARPFAADYPKGATADDTGKLLTDIEGRPLDARFVAGRRVVGGVEEALRPEELVEGATQVVGRDLMGVARSKIPGRAAGAYIVRRGDDGPIRSILFDKNLSDEDVTKVIAHEFGHAIDDIAATIPQKGLSRELKALYNTLNNHNRQGAEAASWGKPSTPQAAGYRDGDASAELMAEAIRAYLTDPNYIKTVAPKTAAAIRKAVNANPQLARIIQFNAAAPVLLGAAPKKDEE